MVVPVNPTSQVNQLVKQATTTSVPAVVPAPRLFANELSNASAVRTISQHNLKAQLKSEEKNPPRGTFLDILV
jgi:hypothetical protein